jgi:hypothetical protein
MNFLQVVQPTFEIASIFEKSKILQGCNKDRTTDSLFEELRQTLDTWNKRPRPNASGCFLCEIAPPPYSGSGTSRPGKGGIKVGQAICSIRVAWLPCSGSEMASFPESSRVLAWKTLMKEKKLFHPDFNSSEALKSQLIIPQWEKVFSRQEQVENFNNDNELKHRRNIKISYLARSDKNDQARRTNRVVAPP